MSIPEGNATIDIRGRGVVNNDYPPMPGAPDLTAPERTPPPQGLSFATLAGVDAFIGDNNPATVAHEAALAQLGGQRHDPSQPEMHQSIREMLAMKAGLEAQRNTLDPGGALHARAQEQIAALDKLIQAYYHVIAGREQQAEQMIGIIEKVLGFLRSIMLVKSPFYTWEPPHYIAARCFSVISQALKDYTAQQINDPEQFADRRERALYEIFHPGNAAQRAPEVQKQLMSWIETALKSTDRYQKTLTARSSLLRSVRSQFAQTMMALTGK